MCANLPSNTLRRPRQTAFQSPFATYLAQIDATPLLSSDEERTLAQRVLDGESEARDHLVRANLRLVVSIARDYVGKGVDLPDLIAEGNLGLMRAVEAFDPSLQVRFSTYASFWIKQSIRRVVINTGKTIRIPAYMNQLLVEWRRMTARLRDDLGREPVEEEIARALKLSKRKLAIIKKAIRIHNAGPAADSEDEAQTIDETVTDARSVSPEDAVIHSDDLKQVIHLLKDLDKRAAAVLRLRFGLDGGDPMTLKEIGERLGLTRERVRQIERDALRALNSQMAVA